MSEKLYAQRNAYELDVAGSFYIRHVSAMTSEGLHSKADIAAELGYRDSVISKLKADYDKLAASFSTLMEQLAITNDAVNRETKLANQYRDKCDKLVAENQFLKESYEDDIGAYSATIHVPNTSSAIAEFKAQGIELLADNLATPNPELTDGTNAINRGMAWYCRQFAANLRAGVKS